MVLSDRKLVIHTAVVLAVIWIVYLSGIDAKIGLDGAGKAAAAAGTPLSIFNLMLRLWRR